MSPFVHLIPLGIAASCWYGLARFSRSREWFRLGEIIFWDAVILIVIFLVWLRWF